MNPDSVHLVSYTGVPVFDCLISKMTFEFLLGYRYKKIQSTMSYREYVTVRVFKDVLNLRVKINSGTLLIGQKNKIRKSSKTTEKILLTYFQIVI